MNKRAALAAAIGILAVSACGGSEGPTTSDTVAPLVDIPADRSLDVSYLDDSIVVSFENVGFAPRAMSADLYRQSDAGWTQVGYLITETADFPSGRLALVSDEPPAILDGALVDERPDRYVAEDLPVGEYAVCAPLIEDQEILCGAFAFDV